ncbi:hypothetical protein AHA_1298 [Aeromonas hydrophila subsp. hydrophila ATCC 7966]|uniref:Uncharacterized protein n=1 Tax=Aeromonas hydrophila subsp. hydrophila (strain ATCC 7966 / DSM 30187 / BCRC 13018 / CCUG 14551 / JCM 1027 / KCTC 2358 / NCIMB 9240 / NCTC 8049) TaxID=380703 RepID=A0KHT7_AERHH|nr:hypothetical protein AHA_1298 [Aeromonas hydrophila subsp. hydrophila ATCC 7966]
MRRPKKAHWLVRLLPHFLPLGIEQGVKEIVIVPIVIDGEGVLLGIIRRHAGHRHGYQDQLPQPHSHGARRGLAIAITAFVDLAEHGKAIAALHLILGQIGGLLAELGLAQFGANGRAGLPRCQGLAKAPRVVIDGGGAAA